MKPSERIQEIIGKKDNIQFSDIFNAIQDYLDEEYEKKKESDEIFKEWVLETKGIKL